MSEKPRRKRGWRYVRNLVIAAVIGFWPIFAVVTVIKGIADAGENVYPTRKALCCTPADLGLTYEKIEFKTEDGLLLRGWYMPSKNGAAILLTHGWNDNREQIMPVAAMLVKAGYGALAFDSRGHGESEGTMIHAIDKDGLAALAYLRGRSDVQNGKIGAYGFSLGGIIVTQAAAQSDAIRAVVADGPGPLAFSDSGAPETFGDWLYVPYDLAFFPSWSARTGGVAALTTADAVKRIAPRPLLLIGATDNSYERRNQALFYAAAGEPKRLWMIKGTLHGSGWLLYPDEYAKEIVGFFDKALLQ